MSPLTAAKVRNSFAETLNRVAYAKERVLILRHGKPVAALIPIEDLEALQAMENRVDLEAAREALADPGPSIPHAEVKAGLGLR